MRTSPLPSSSLLPSEIIKLSVGGTHTQTNASLRGGSSIDFFSKNKKSTKYSMQSIKYEEDDFQLIPYYPFRNKYEKYVQSHLPILYWLPKYKWRDYFIYDLIAAMTAVVMVIPQSMGYALIAGLPPIHGLYSAMFGHSLYSLLGTSGQLIIAPVAIVSLMTEETLARLPGIDHDDDNTSLYVSYASCLSFQVGIIALSLGLVNAGIFANMLAEPVIIGFTFGAAILIGMSQLKFLFQIEIDGEELIVNFVSLFQNISNIHINSLILSIICIILLLIHKFGQNKFKWFKFIPMALIIVIIVTIISSMNKPESESTESDSTPFGWDIIGSDIYNGLPSFNNFFNSIDMNTFWGLWTSSLIITIIAYIETIAVATKFAEKHNYTINASQELIALGVCNLVGCWFQIYPIAGVLSLAAVVESAGALTPLYTAIAGTSIIIITSFFITIFEYLPKPVLGSIVCVGILNLIDVHNIRRIYRISLKDFFVLLCTVLMTLIIGIDYGVLCGVIGSLLMFIYQSTVSPEYGQLGKTDDNNYKFIKYYPNDSLISQTNILILRWDEVLFFGNSQIFKQNIKKDIKLFLTKNSHNISINYNNKWCLILCFDAINHIDFTALDTLHSFIVELNHKNEECTLLITNVHYNILETLKKSNLITLIKEENIFQSINDAEKWWNNYSSNSNNNKTILKKNTNQNQNNNYSLNKFQVINTTASLPLISMTNSKQNYT